MRTEIERKFLLPEPPEWLGDLPSKLIDQGYLAIEDRVEVRLRRAGDDLTLTVKSGRGRSRGEQEIELTAEQFDALWPLTESRRVRKRRYLREAEQGKFEIDVYEGDLEGMVVAEMEFVSERASESFEPPAWLGGEVTGDDRYANRSLAADGRPDGKR